MAIFEPSKADASPLMEIEDLVIRFPIRKGGRRAFITPVDHVSFSLRESEVLSIVGESGSGKSTIGRTLVRVNVPSHGRVLYQGRDVSHIKGAELRLYRSAIQMIFQDPFGSLNPVRTVEQHLTFPLRKYEQVTGDKLSARIDELLGRVGLTPVRETRSKYPHELSGGQRQRVAIARALAVGPRVLVADEPISMLDVSIRAGILELMNELKRDFRISFLYITHDLASARYFGDRILVLYGGRVMELAPSSELIRNPLHPYTRLLLAASPGNPSRGPLPETSNSAPNLLEGRRGCPFADRCPLVTDVCRDEVPNLVDHGTSQLRHFVACHHA